MPYRTEENILQTVLIAYRSMHSRSSAGFVEPASLILDGGN